MPVCHTFSFYIFCLAARGEPPPESSQFYFFEKMIYSTINRNNGKVILNKILVSKPIILSPLIMFNDLNIKNTITPNDIL